MRLTPIIITKNECVVIGITVMQSACISHYSNAISRLMHYSNAVSRLMHFCNDISNHSSNAADACTQPVTC
jgi:hypothetical protein